MSGEANVIKRYFVSRQRENSPSVSDGLTRAEVMALQNEKARELGDSIKERFPEVEVIDITIFAPLIQINTSEDKFKELVQNIQTEFVCTLVDAETPMHLI